MEFKKIKLNEVLTLNPTLKLKKNTIAKKIAMENINEYQKKIDGYTYSGFKSGSKFMNGDTLLARITPCLENGKTAYVDILDENEIAFGSTEFFVLRPKDNLMDSHFLYYLMRTNELRNTIIKSMTGTSGRQRAQKESILEYEFCLPSLKVQIAIAKLLKNLDDKIETNKKIIANLEELSQTLFKRWFVDFEFPDENGNPYKSSGGEMADSELGEKPINWDVAKLRSIVNIRTGYAFKSTEYVEQRQLPVLRTLNISKSNLLVTMNEIKYVPYQYLYIDKYKNYNLELFDTLLVTVGGSIGNLGLVTENNIPSLQNQNMWRFRSIKSNIGNTLVYQLILYVNSLVRNQTSGSAREFYTKKTFENFSLLLPKEDSYLYENINKYLENFGKKISDLNVEIEKLTQLRDTLLPKLMSGEIEMPDDIEVMEDELSI
ncbi:restriction endonuclease subunit S [Staphylococcus agnetis]|nr:restriction endonuclease subunit S [Staphylococcus agnetis]ALN77622.1 restriction endonuclease subunit S [Staphylococcus agnetis]